LRISKSKSFAEELIVHILNYWLTQAWQKRLNDDST